MTTQCKDEMPDVQHECGSCQYRWLDWPRNDGHANMCPNCSVPERLAQLERDKGKLMLELSRADLSPPVPDDVADLAVLSSEIQGVGNYLNCYCKTWNISFQKIVDRLRTEITMHKAWEKRAYQAEKELNDFRPASKPSAEVRALREALSELLVIVDKYTPCQSGSSFINAKKLLGGE